MERILDEDAIEPVAAIRRVERAEVEVGSEFDVLARTRADVDRPAVSVFRELETLRSLEPAWRALEAQSQHAVVFQSFDWCRHIWHTRIAGPGAGGGTFEPRVLVIGDADFIGNDLINFQGNGDLFMNMVNWVAQQENLIAIGPKELPGVLRMVGQWMGKARKLASEFQGQFQEAMREAEMADLKKSFDEVREATSGLSTSNVLTKLGTELSEAAAIDKAVEAAVAAQEATGDVGGKLGTRETGEAFAKRLRG